MNKRGRPPKAVCKSELVHLRVTVAEKQALLERAKSMNLTLAELVLRSCLPGRYLPIPNAQLTLVGLPAPTYSEETRGATPPFDEQKAIQKQWE